MIREEFVDCQFSSLAGVTVQCDNAAFTGLAFFRLRQRLQRLEKPVSIQR